MDGLAALRRVADVVLTSDAGLTELYERKAPFTTGAQAGHVEAVDRRTGVSYALHEIELAGLPAASAADIDAPENDESRVRDWTSTVTW